MSGLDQSAPDVYGWVGLPVGPNLFRYVPAANSTPQVDANGRLVLTTAGTNYPLQFPVEKGHRIRAVHYRFGTATGTATTEEESIDLLKTTNFPPLPGITNVKQVIYRLQTNGNSKNCVLEAGWEAGGALYTLDNSTAITSGALLELEVLVEYFTLLPLSGA